MAGRRVRNEHYFMFVDLSANTEGERENVALPLFYAAASNYYSKSSEGSLRSKLGGNDTLNSCDVCVSIQPKRAQASKTKSQ